jgi:cytidine deaminase
VGDAPYTRLLKQAKQAQKHALATFSDFPVGAALSTKAGQIYSGCNIENSSYGLTICAERVALFKALSEGQSEFEAIAVTANTKEFCPPCGACRQVLMEHAPNLKIILLNLEGSVKELSISELLPEAFDKSFFHRKGDPG